MLLSSHELKLREPMVWSAIWCDKSDRNIRKERVHWNILLYHGAIAPLSQFDQNFVHKHPYGYYVLYFFFYQGSITTHMYQDKESRLSLSILSLHLNIWRQQNAHLEIQITTKHTKKPMNHDSISHSTYSLTMRQVEHDETSLPIAHTLCGPHLARLH